MLRPLLLASLLGLPFSRAGAQGPSGDRDPSELTGEPVSGGVVAIGGGTLPDRIYRRMLELTGRKDPAVLLLPLATSEPDVSGPRTEERFRQCGATRVDWKHFRREDANDSEIASAIRAAHLVFFPGGDQKRILAALRGTDAERALHDVLGKGGVVGGTSAGCEVLGDLSLTGNARTDLAVAGATEVEPGLGCVPGVVFDQHFLRRSRFLRLLSATLEAPKKIGIGVDESTAVVVPHGTRVLEVIGERQVAVFRAAEDSRALDAKSGELARAANLRLHLLAEGDRYDLDRDAVTFGSKPVAAPPESRSAPESRRADSAASRPAR